MGRAKGGREPSQCGYSVRIARRYAGSHSWAPLSLVQRAEMMFQLQEDPGSGRGWAAAPWWTRRGRASAANERRTAPRTSKTIAVHKGRVAKRTSDGTVVEFRSVVEAVCCGIEIQDSMIERNAGLPPEVAHRISRHHYSRQWPRLSGNVCSWQILLQKSWRLRLAQG